MPCWEYILRDLPRCTQLLDNGRRCPAAGMVCDVFTRVLYCGHHAPVTNESRRAKATEGRAVRKAVRAAYGHLWKDCGPIRRVGG
jgi:hypothetical protein